MRYDKITVVINTFNSEDKIHQCLKSLESSKGNNYRKF